MSSRLVVLVSGTGTNLQSLLDACAEDDFGARIVAVGADRPGTTAILRAQAAGVDTFELLPAEFTDRATWDAALTERVAAAQPDLVVLAGFMRLAGKAFLARFGSRVVNTHPALLPAFPGMQAPRDAIEYGVKVTGATLFLVDSGVDTGAIVAQTVVPVEDGDTDDTLHERIKVAERAMLVEQVGRMARNGFTINGRKVTVL
ncbi:MAG: phosphoribosylglycinamide formyltransferase [Nocardioidaceae bacterium]